MFKQWLEALEKLTNVNPAKYNLQWKNNNIPNYAGSYKANDYQADFSIGNISYFISFFKEDGNEWDISGGNVWDISFGVIENKNKQSTGWESSSSPHFVRTNEFNTIGVMQYVIAAMKIFIKNVAPDKFSYSPNDDKLARLYDRIKMKIKNEFPYVEASPNVFVRK